MSLPWIIFEVFLNFFDVAFFMSIMTKKLSVKPWVKKIHIAFIYISIVAMFCLINFSTEFSTVSFFLFPLFYIIYSFCFLEGSSFDKWFWLVFPHMIIAYTELFIIYITMYMSNDILGGTFYIYEHRLVWAIIVKVLEFLMWLFLIKEENEKIHLKSLTIFTFICIITLASVTLMVTFSTPDVLKILNIQKMINLTLFLSILSLLLCFYDFVQTYKVKIEELEAKVKLNELEASWKIINAYKGVRKIRTTHLLYDKPSIIKNGDNSDLLEYRTGDNLIDAVLAVKEAEAFDFGAKLILSGNIPIKKTISSESMCFILDHLLSISIDNVHMINDSSVISEIELTFLEFKKGFSIYVGNPIDDLTAPIDFSSIENVLKDNFGEITSNTDDFYNSTLVFLPYIGV